MEIEILAFADFRGRLEARPHHPKSSGFLQYPTIGDPHFTSGTCTQMGTPANASKLQGAARQHGMGAIAGSAFSFSPTLLFSNRNARRGQWEMRARFALGAKSQIFGKPGSASSLEVRRPIKHPNRNPDGSDHHSYNPPALSSQLLAILGEMAGNDGRRARSNRCDLSEQRVEFGTSPTVRG
jgi:hypothetical protein